MCCGHAFLFPLHCKILNIRTSKNGKEGNFYVSLPSLLLYQKLPLFFHVHTKKGGRGQSNGLEGHAGPEGQEASMASIRHGHLTFKPAIETRLMYGFPNHSALTIGL